MNKEIHNLREQNKKISAELELYKDNNYTLTQVIS